MAKTKDLPLVVTTAHRGVFFGYGSPGIPDDKKVQLNKARMVVYWTSEMRSVLGLAAIGPGVGCKIGPAVPSITLADVTAVIEVDDEAARKFEAAPWN